MTDAERRLRHLLFLVAHASRRNGRPLREVARRLGVAPREVASYADELLMCGRYPFAGGDLIDVEVDPNEERVFVHLDQRLGRPVRFTQQEALALAAALGALGSSRGPFASVAASILGKLRARLGEDVRRRVEELEHRIAVQSDDRSVPERFQVLRRGLEERRAVEIHYYTASRDEMNRRRVRPYLLVQHLGWWYLVGLDDKSGDVRTFKVERVKEAHLTDERFEVPPSFDAEKYRRRRMFVGGPERQALVRFFPPVARIIAEEWSPARITRERSGTVVARVDFVHPEGFANWILSFGEAAEVVEPVELRAMVTARCRAALEGCA